MRKFSIALLLLAACLSTSVARAATPAVAAAQSAAPARDWSAIVGPKSVAGSLAECMQFVKVDATSTSVTLPDGKRLVFRKDATGKTTSAVIVSQTGAVIKTFDAAAIDAPTTFVPPYVARDESYAQMKTLARAVMLNALRNECHAFAVQAKAGGATVSKTLGGSQGNVIMTGCNGDSGDDDGPPIMSGDCSTSNGGAGGAGAGSGGAGGEDDNAMLAAYEDMLDSSIDSDFEVASADFAYQASTSAPKKCAAVVSQCRDACESLGAWETRACGIFAGLSEPLNPAIATAAGFYCGGRVYVSTEKCKAGCSVPKVPCIQ